jgi:hypothetical protein
MSERVVAVTLLARIQELQGSNLGLDTGCPKLGFYRSLRANGGITPRLHHDCFLSDSFPIHY